MATDTLVEEGVSPELIEPDFPYEVVRGQIVAKPTMSAQDNMVATELFRALVLFDPQKQLGQSVFEILFMLDRENNVRRRPDLAFVSRDRWPVDRPIERANYWDVVPDLAIEAVSPSNVADLDLEKLDDYFRAGVRQVWFVYSGARRVYVYDSPKSVRILGDGDDLEGADILPGFRLALTRLFGSKPPPSRP
ncbi:MAG: Uma2 family endonuclease [Isosphaeraceae bacterium]|nr:Uma2 family endonuclease [Isosphaeraceae bacterium]